MLVGSYYGVVIENIIRELQQDNVGHTNFATFSIFRPKTPSLLKDL